MVNSGSRRSTSQCPPICWETEAWFTGVGPLALKLRALRRTKVCFGHQELLLRIVLHGSKQVVNYSQFMSIHEPLFRGHVAHWAWSAARLIRQQCLPSFIVSMNWRCKITVDLVTRTIEKTCQSPHVWVWQSEMQFKSKAPILWMRQGRNVVYVLHDQPRACQGLPRRSASGESWVWVRPHRQSSLSWWKQYFWDSRIFQTNGPSCDMSHGEAKQTSGLSLNTLTRLWKRRQVLVMLLASWRQSSQSSKSHTTLSKSRPGIQISKWNLRCKR